MRYTKNVFEKNTVESGKKTYFLAYTLLFIITVFFVFSWYILSGKTFIWQDDGWSQHYKALFYYAKYLRSIISSLLFEHKFSIPLWDFTLGEGNDILSTLHYYVIGDPFSIFSVFIPVRFLHWYYDAMVILRLYLSGVAFSFLCFQTGIKSRYAVMAGTLTYVFCYWSVYNAARHPYFLNPMIYFPMMIIGIEKIFKKERPYLFIFTVFLSAISNFYFFYMIVLTTIIYVVVRILFLHRNNIKQIFRVVFKIGFSSIIGVLFASVIFLPICYTFLNDTRMETAHTFHLFYPLSYYGRLPALFISEGDIYWTCMGFSIPVLFAVFLLFCKRKENKLLKIFFVLCMIIFSIPALGQILNGFSYMSNRWCWAFALLTAYILAKMWPFLIDLAPKYGVILFAYITIYFLACVMFEYSRSTKVFVSIIFAFIFLILLLPYNEVSVFSYKKKQYLALMIVIVSIINNSFWKNSSAGDNYAASCKDIKNIADELRANETCAVLNAASSEKTTDFYRYSGRSLTYNAGMLTGLSSTQYYWSLSNPYINKFRTITEQVENNAFMYRGYDDRSTLLSLASVLYYVIPENDFSPVPYGFSYIKTVNVKGSSTTTALEELKKELRVEDLSEDQVKMIRSATQRNYRVYHNDNALPLGYTYENYITSDSWKQLSSIEKQESLLQMVILDKHNNLGNALPEFTNQNIEYTLSCNGSDISMKNNAFIVTSDKATATLTFKSLPNSETYFNIEDLYFCGVPVYDLYWGSIDVDPQDLYNRTNWEKLPSENKKSIVKNKIFWNAPTTANLSLKSSTGVSKILSYYTEDYSFYNGRHNFTVNLGYSEDTVTSVTITFPSVGIYSFNSIGITCQPMKQYMSQINALKKDTLKNVTVDTNSVTGIIALDKPKFLCMSIPYSKGWSAYVDGEKSELYQANIAYMALALETGTHTIELFYETPLLKEGIYISLITGSIFFIYIFFSEKKRRIKQ